MKQYLLCIVFLSLTLPSFGIEHYQTSISNNAAQNGNDRELTQEEVKKRGIDLLATKVIEGIEDINLKNMARSSIFETSYGFRWKMFNVKTGKILIIKVNQDFQLLSAKHSVRS
ncbi:hypothetical protein [Aquimarina addita]